MRALITVLSIVAIVANSVFLLSSVKAGNTIGGVISAIWVIAWLLWFIKPLKP